MATVNATISRVRIPPDLSYTITVSLYYKQYYATDFTLIDTGVPLDSDGNILQSPLPTISALQTDEKYVLKAVNEMCGAEYLQNLFIHAYCPVGYEMADDETYCFKELITVATAPTGSPDTLQQETFAAYSTCGSYIYDAGYNVNGTGTSNQITTANAFWINWDGITQCANYGTTDGPLNRAGLWASVVEDNQTIGFAVCITVPETKTYYVGIGCDNYGTIKLDGVTIVEQDATALGIQYPFAGSTATFKIWHIYPVEIQSGAHILEILGTNVAIAATLGAEIYNNTSAEIIAATSYGDLDLIFSTKDYFGTTVQLGSDGTGYSCPDGYALQTCSSPYVCVKLLTTDVIIG